MPTLGMCMDFQNGLGVARPQLPWCCSGYCCAKRSVEYRECGKRLLTRHIFEERLGREMYRVTNVFDSVTLAISSKIQHAAVDIDEPRRTTAEGLSSQMQDKVTRIVMQRLEPLGRGTCGPLIPFAELVGGTRSSSITQQYVNTGEGIEACLSAFIAKVETLPEIQPVGALRTFAKLST